MLDIEILRRLRNMGAVGQVPIVVVTAQVMNEDRHRALGADACLVTPMDIGEFRRMAAGLFASATASRRSEDRAKKHAVALAFAVRQNISCQALTIHRGADKTRASMTVGRRGFRPKRCRDCQRVTV